MFNFEKLDVWREAIQLADFIYKISAAFPERERLGLTNQMRRAAVCVSSNLAEGNSRNSRADFARFVEIATRSLFEVVSQARISLEQGFLDKESHDHIYTAAEKQSRMLSGLRRAPDRCRITLNSQLFTLIRMLAFFSTFRWPARPLKT